MNNAIFDRAAALSAAREAAKPYLLEYVESITEASPKAGKLHYICPVCGSGTGGDGTGAFSVTSDLLHFECFACGIAGDTTDLLMKVENITEQAEAVKRLAELYPGIKTGATPASYKPKDRTPPAPNRPGRYTDFLERAAADVGKTDYWKMRGFTAETVARFRLGYVEHFGANICGPAVTMPFDPVHSYYMVRSVNGKAFYKPSKEIAGACPVYNRAALYAGVPCFVCEAPIDAISIEQAGGKAVATGGTSHENFIDLVKRKRPPCPVILCFDPDAAGTAATEKAKKELDAVGVPYIVADFARETYPHGETLKDPNDLLRADAVHFAADIKRITENARAASVPDLTPPAESGADASADLTPPATSETLETPANVYNASDYTLTGEFDAELAYFKRFKDRKTGFINLDKYLTLYPGLCALGGAASLGKTTFAVNLAENLARAGETVLYIALEQDPVELFTKVIARNNFRNHPDTMITNIDIKNGVTSPEIIEARGEIAEALGGLFFEKQNFYANVETIRESVLAFIRRTGKKPVVFIDYLQLLSPSPLDASRDTRSQTDYNLKALKTLQRELELFIVLISNFNRSSYRDPVSYEAFKESGMIEYTCDYVLGLQLAILSENIFYTARGPLGGIRQTTEIEKHRITTHETQAIPKAVEIVSLKNRNGKQSFKARFAYYVQFDAFIPCEAWTPPAFSELTGADASADLTAPENPEAEEAEELKNRIKPRKGKTK